MSKSRTMLRTRRKDNNVKPNRRLDRKSSRGMLFENEDLRLKTININAEVERGQSDIKKLKRENDQLRREIWYLRDEYDKLDKLLREKECQDSSSSSSSSESESCSSCTEESEPVETSQNKENFQKTNLKKITEEFDLLSVVPEENSTENSERNSNNSNRISPEITTNVQLENAEEINILKADQSYPELPNALPMPKHFFAPIKNSKPNDDYVNNQFLGPESPYRESHFVQHYCDSLEPGTHNGFVPTSSSYPGFILPSLPKSTTDVVVKIDNQNFNTINSHSSFSNGGNLEELLNDIETISHDILKISNPQGAQALEPPQNFCPPFPCFLPPDTDTQTEINYFPTQDPFEPLQKPQYINGVTTSRPYKSELNVVLMPTPMQLIGVEKYKNIQKSCESLNARSYENLTDNKRGNLILTPASLYSSPSHTPIATPKPPDIFQPIVPVPPYCPGPENRALLENLHQHNEQTNPFYFGSIRQQQDDYFNPNYVPESCATKLDNSKLQVPNKKDEIYGSKTNLLDTTASSDHISSENEENIKFKTSRNEKESKSEVSRKDNEATKSPKNLRHKVSIHFKGKKDKTKKEDTPTVENKKPFFDLKFTSDSKDKKVPNVAESKTPSSDTKLQNQIEVKKTTESSSTSDQRSSERKTYDAKMPDSKNTDRSRKSSSPSPERKHGHKETKKGHKKHKKSDKNKSRRSSLSIDRFGRERSFSVCTDRSNILDHRLGMYDDLTTSDRERTNSLSSCDTVKGRKMSNLQHIPSTGKIPWCGCWGNGCL